MNELKSCPFCGGEAKRFYGTLEEAYAKREKRPPLPPYEIYCRGCRAKIQFARTDDEWNLRV